MPLTDKEKRKEYERNYRLRNLEKVRAWGRNWLRKHRADPMFREKEKATKKKYRENFWIRYHSNPEFREKVRIKNNRKHLRYITETDYFHNKYAQWREEALTILGGRCQYCGFDNPMALQIHHVNGDGAKERRESSKYKQYRLMLQRIREGSENYKIACANCNIIMARTGTLVPFIRG